MKCVYIKTVTTNIEYILAYGFEILIVFCNIAIFLALGTTVTYY